MICFEFLRILEKNHKKEKQENLDKHGLLRGSVGSVALRRSVGCLCRSMGCPRRGDVEVPKRAPLEYATT